MLDSFNPFHATGLFLYPQKILEDQRFSEVFGDGEGGKEGIKRYQMHEMSYNKLSRQ